MVTAPPAGRLRVCYRLLITPIAWGRRLALRDDPFDVRAFGRGTGSVLHELNHEFTAADFTARAARQRPWRWLRPTGTPNRRRP
ncbi:hypothetical protein [Kitasatospora purpeofusca]|uniref:hypothetical protein n=1 Tax=Kitasatospora purpeofusca TaxID=67352 RepID=UPI0036D2D7C0